MVTIIVFLLILSVLVLIHELGHFFVAKKLGIKVEEFGFGFPPRVFGIKRGETLYSLNLLPIGGFVKLYGEDEAGGGKLKVGKQGEIKDKDRAFFARPVHQRAAVVIAGVVMNFILAVAIISYLFTVQGVPSLGDKVLVTKIVANSPAAQAGLKEGDTIEEVDSVKITNATQLVSETRKHLGETVTIKARSKDNKERVVKVTPRKNYPPDQGPMGVAISQNVVITKYPWYKAPFLGTKEVFNQSALILTGLGTVVRDIVTRGSIPQGVAGPVGIAQLTGEFVQTGVPAVLSFMALLSLNLAVLNILPIPALDGGRLFFILIEAVTRRKVNPKFEAYAHAVGIAILLTLIAIITLNDFLRIFRGESILPQ